MRQFLLLIVIGLFVTNIAHANTVKACVQDDDRLMSPDKSWGTCSVSINGKFTWSTNGRDGELYDWTGMPDFSSDNKTFAYKARIGLVWFVVTGYRDGRQFKGKSYSEIESIIWNLDNPRIKFAVFGPSGKLAYSARQDNNWFIVSDHESPAYEWSRPIIFSPDGSKFGYKAKLNGKWFVVVDDKPRKSFDWVSIPIFSSDGKNFAYKARVGREWFIVRGDEIIGPYDGVSFPSWSPDSKELIYQANFEGKWHVIRGREVGKGYERTASISGNNDYRDFGMLTFNKDSKKLEYIALIEGKWIVVTDGVEGGPYVYPEIKKTVEPKINILGSTPVEQFQNANGKLRSTASRVETRLDKLAEKDGYENTRFWDKLVDIRLDIHKSEELVAKASGDSLKGNLKAAKKYSVSAKKKLLSLLNEIK